VVNQVMPDRGNIFQNWTDNCSIEVKKLVLWNPRSLKLFEEIERQCCISNQILPCTYIQHTANYMVGMFCFISGIFLPKVIKIGPS